MARRSHKVDKWGTVPVYVRLDPAVADKLDSLVASTSGTVKSVVTELVRGARVVEVPGTVRVMMFTGDAQRELPGVKPDDSH